jgi:hypothetical protein
MATSQSVLAPIVPTSTPRRLFANLEVWLVSAGLIVTAVRAGTSEASGASWIIVLLNTERLCFVSGQMDLRGPPGILVTERNVMSLSRFQMVLWTLLILSGYLITVMRRVHAGIANPFDIGIDWKLWALMGISTASLVGSPLLVQQKATQ